ncbi:MAG TPA: MFS transporter [Ktedonobacterales bacterium]|nr:MFS transporter [Ktedonobacterales bacterium]
MSDVAPSSAGDLAVPQSRVASSATFAFYVFFAINFLNYLDRFILTGASNAVGHELNLGIDQIGQLSGAFTIALTLSAIPFGIWADRSSRKKVIAVAVLIWSLATGFTALAGNFFTLFLTRSVLGVGEGGYSPASSALLADYFSRAKRAQVLSRLATALFIGLMFGIIIGGIVAGIGPGAWRWGFVFTGIPGLVLAFLAWRIREPRRNQADAEEAEAAAVVLEESAISGEMIVPKNVFSQLGTILRIKTVLVLTVMQIFAYAVLSASITYLVILFQQKDSFGMTSTQAGLFTGFGVALAAIPGAILGGYVSDIINRRYPGARVLVCGLGFLVGAPSYLLSVIVGVGTHNIVLYGVFFFLTTLLLNLYLGPGAAAICDVVPSSLRASAVAISVFASNILGTAFAPALVGALAKALDPTGGQHFVHNVAGVDLSLALAYTCPAALAIAGVVGVIGARWVKDDMRRAQRAESQTALAGD